MDYCKFQHPGFLAGFGRKLILKNRAQLMEIKKFVSKQPEHFGPLAEPCFSGLQLSGRLIPVCLAVLKISSLVQKDHEFLQLCNVPSLFIVSGLKPFRKISLLLLCCNVLALHPFYCLFSRFENGAFQSSSP